MRKKLKKYNNGGFVSQLLNTLNAVPGQDGSSIPGFGQLNVGSGSTSDGVLLNAMHKFAGNTVPPNLMGSYRRGSINAAMGGIPNQFSFMNSFMQQNQLGNFAPQPEINTNPMQFMPQAGFNAQQETEMDAADQALQPSGPINMAGPQVGMPGNPNVNMAPAPTIAPPTVTSSAYGNFPKTGIVPTMNMQPFIDANTPANSGTLGGSGMGQANIESSLGQSILGEANEFDQAKNVVNQAKGTVSTLKKIVGEDVFKSHAAKLLSKLPGKTGSKLAAKVAAAGAKEAGTKFGTFLGSKAGATASLGVGLLGKGIQELDKKDGNYSRLGAMGGGALQGAALGSMIGPLGTVAGGLIGAGIGEIQRKKFENNARAEELTTKTILAKDNARTRLQSKQILANVPTQGVKDQIYEEGGLVQGGDKKGPAKAKYIPKGDSITLDMINQYMTDTRSTAANPYDFEAAIDTMAYHESGMDPQRQQMGSGPGRGIGQYDKPSALAASNRLRDLSKLWKKPNPKWNTAEGTEDFSKLTVEQQKMLWMADKLMDKTVDLAALGMGEEPLKDFWADHHWRGADSLRTTRQNSFEIHRKAAKALGLPKYKAEAAQPKPKSEPKMDMLVPNVQAPYNPAMFGSLPINPEEFKPDTVKISFEEGGETDPAKLVESSKDPALTAYMDSLNLYNFAQQLKDGVPSARDTGGGSSFFAENRMVPQEQSFPMTENRYFNLSEMPGYEDSNIVVSGLGDEQSYNVDEPATAEDLKRFKEEFAKDPTKLTHYEVSHPSIKPTGIYDATSGDSFKQRMLRGVGMDPYSSYNATYDKPTQEVKLAPVTKNYITKTLTSNPLDSVGLGSSDPIDTPAPVAQKPEPVKKTTPPPTPKKKETPVAPKAKPEPVYIYNAANTGGSGSTRTGQIPRAKRVWDDKRKQWKEVPLTKEEITAYKEKYSFQNGGSTPKGKDQGPSIRADDPRFDASKARAEAMYRLRNPYADLNLPPSGRTDYVFGPVDTMLGLVPFSKLAGTLAKRTALQGVKKYAQGRNVGFPLGKYGKREAVQGIRREAPLLGFEQALGLDLMSTDLAKDYPLKERQQELSPYKYGGNTDKFDYIAEGGEVIVHKPGDVPNTDQNGYLTSLGSNVKMINGDKHSASSGGVKMGQDESAFIYSDKLKLSKEMQKKIYGSNGKLRF